ncbi:MAG: EAL domain-containing protein, partial [Gammaproteobacteria bacterium]|nr:EAL domain-containing protein [Gammaproteobacteria bacterium]
EDIEKVVIIINALKDHGIRFSMDDFGTGYSSLSYLHRLPINELKIDSSFINTLEENDDSQTLIKTIISMAKNFKLNIVAEGIETEYQFDYLTQLDCDLFQGFYFSRPLKETDFIKFYQSHED